MFNNLQHIVHFSDYCYITLHSSFAEMHFEFKNETAGCLSPLERTKIQRAFIFIVSTYLIADLKPLSTEFCLLNVFFIQCL